MATPAKAAAAEKAAAADLAPVSEPTPATGGTVPPIPQTPAQPPAPVWRLLSEASREVGAVRKTQQAPGSIGGYQFRGVDAVVNAVHPVLARLGVIVLPEVLDVSRDTVPASNGKSMMNVTVRVRFTFHGPAGDGLAVTVVGEAADTGDKASSKAQSVALRVALLQALLLPTDEPDPDASGYERAGSGERGMQDASARRQQPRPADEGSQEREVPAHVAALAADLQALSPEQAQYVRANWPQGLPGLYHLTVAGVAQVRELLGSVPPF
jgi:hypothetical protein